MFKTCFVAHVSQDASWLQAALASAGAVAVLVLLKKYQDQSSKATSRRWWVWTQLTGLSYVKLFGFALPNRFSYEWILPTTIKSSWNTCPSCHWTSLDSNHFGPPKHRCWSYQYHFFVDYHSKAFSPTLSLLFVETASRMTLVKRLQRKCIPPAFTLQRPRSHQSQGQDSMEETIDKFEKWRTWAYSYCIWKAPKKAMKAMFWLKHIKATFWNINSASDPHPGLTKSLGPSCEAGWGAGSGGASFNWRGGTAGCQGQGCRRNTTWLPKKVRRIQYSM